MRFTNNQGVSLAMAVWLATDEYDYDFDPKSISVTSLIAPVRKILLKERLTPETRPVPDIADFTASKMGTAIHDSIERAWKNNYAGALRMLGHPEKFIQQVVINPETVEPDQIPIYVEQRIKTPYRGYNIRGKFDLVIDGVLQDTKTTSVYSYMLGSKDEDYALQGSLYRWLNQEKITADYMQIQFCFTDWQKSLVGTRENYPPSRTQEHTIGLLSIAETEAWINAKLDELEKFADAPEEQIPMCSDKDLWRSPAVYKYFSDPMKTTGRSTKNFKSLAEANQLKTKKGRGVVLTVPGTVKACGYCPAFDICTQKDGYDHG